MVLGPEKLLEVWFAPSPTSLPPGVPSIGLKAVPKEVWEPMLDLVDCKVLSTIETPPVDSYLLSESSMFVFPHKLILKTCGTTTLLLGLQRMLHIAATHAGFPFHNAESVDDIRAAATPYRIFYSRKNFLFPDKQRGPHKSWKQEVKYLDDMFDGGSAYMVGKMNGDHWYLYITSPNQSLTPPRTPESETQGPVSRIPVGSTFGFGTGGQQDETLEILMTDLDPENAKQFYMSDASAVAGDKLAAEAQEARREAANSLDEPTMFDDTLEGEDAPSAPVPAVDDWNVEGHALGTVVSESCGLSSVYPTSIFPDAKVDAFAFSPCGFSANGVVPPVQTEEGAATGTGHYWTVHVTPEPQCSFASFETNVPSGQTGRTTTEIIEQVVRIFKPGRFSVTLFEAKGHASNPYGGGEEAIHVRQRFLDPIRGYRRIDRIVHDFEDYDLVFRFYERDGWAGDKRARVGEYA